MWTRGLSGHKIRQTARKKFIVPNKQICIIHRDSLQTCAVSSFSSCFIHACRNDYWLMRRNQIVVKNNLWWDCGVKNVTGVEIHSCAGLADYKWSETDAICASLLVLHESSLLAWDQILFITGSWCSMQQVPKCQGPVGWGCEAVLQGPPQGEILWLSCDCVQKRGRYLTPLIAVHPHLAESAAGNSRPSPPRIGCLSLFKYCKGFLLKK